MRLGSKVGLALAGVFSLWGAGDFWRERTPDSWSESEIRQMVTASPWAKPATVRIGRDSGTGLPPILVRWESAAPVIAACSLGGMQRPLFTCASKLLYLTGLGPKFDALRETYYIVSLSNYPKPPQTAGDPPEHSDAGNAGLAAMSRRIQDATFLKRPGRPDLGAEQVIALPAGETLLLLIFFPRAGGLSAEDGDVAFESADGTRAFQAAFDLREMIFGGRLEL
jgi:hypothetical protein